MNPDRINDTVHELKTSAEVKLKAFNKARRTMSDLQGLLPQVISGDVVQAFDVAMDKSEEFAPVKNDRQALRVLCNLLDGILLKKGHEARVIEDVVTRFNLLYKTLL